MMIRFWEDVDVKAKKMGVSLTLWGWILSIDLFSLTSVQLLDGPPCNTNHSYHTHTEERLRFFNNYSKTCHLRSMFWTATYIVRPLYEVNLLYNSTSSNPRSGEVPFFLKRIQIFLPHFGIYILIYTFVSFAGLIVLETPLSLKSSDYRSFTIID